MVILGSQKKAKCLSVAILDSQKVAKHLSVVIKSRLGRWLPRLAQIAAGQVSSGAAGGATVVCSHLLVLELGPIFS